MTFKVCLIIVSLMTAVAQDSDTLIKGSNLNAPAQLLNKANTAHFEVQEDGNLVVRQTNLPNGKTKVLWASHTDGKGKGKVHLELQGDGNLVLYADDSNPSAIWVKGQKKAAKLILQGDCNLVLYDSGGKGLWATNTRCMAIAAPIVCNVADLTAKYLPNTKGIVQGLKDSEKIPMMVGLERNENIWTNAVSKSGVEIEEMCDGIVLNDYDQFCVANNEMLEFQLEATGTAGEIFNTYTEVKEELKESQASDKFSETEEENEEEQKGVGCVIANAEQGIFGMTIYGVSADLNLPGKVGLSISFDSMALGIQGNLKGETFCFFCFMFFYFFDFFDTVFDFPYTVFFWEN